MRRSSRWSSLALGALLAFGGLRSPPARAEPPSSPEAAARAAVAAFDGPGRAQAGRARSDPPDGPSLWSVVDELLAQGRADVAGWLAGRAAPVTADALRAYLARQGQGADPAAARALWAAGPPPVPAPAPTRAALLEQLALCDAPPGEVRILAVRLAFRAGHACGGAGDGAGERRAYEAAARAAARLGGWGEAELGAALALAEHLLARGDGAAALAALEHALPLAPAFAERPEAGRLLLELAALHLERGDAAECERLVRSVLEQRPVGVDPRLLALAVSNLGLVELRRGHLAGALARHREAQALLPERGADAHALELRLRIAGVHEQTGALEAAITGLDEVATGFRSLPVPDVEGEALAQGNRARALLLAGRPAEARQALARARALSAELGLAPNVAQADVLCGWIDASSDVEPGTVEAVERVLAAPDVQAGPTLRAQALEALARLHLRQAAPAEAVRRLREAAALLPDLPAGDTLRVDLPGSLGVALARAGQPVPALEAFDRYVEGAAGSVDGLELGTRTTFRGLVAREILEAAVAAALAARDLPRLWRYLEAGRGLRLLAALGGRSALGEALLPEALYRELSAAQDGELGARRALALAKERLGEFDPGLVPLRERHDRARAERAAAAARVDEARRFQGRDELGPAADLQPLEAVRRRLPPATVLLSLTPLAGDDVLVGLLSATGFEARVAPLGAALGGRARDLRARATAAASAAGTPPGAAAAAAAGEALADLRAAAARLALWPAGTRRVLVVPEGPLAYVPYAALWPDLDVALLTSGTLYHRLAGEARRAGTQVLALGDPDYSGKRLGTQLAALASLAPGPTRWGRARLDPLPHTRAEALAAAGPAGVSLLGPGATAPALLEALRAHPGRRWRSLHFACHGLIHPEQPTLSGLALTDGLLTPHEILPLRLSTDLVVLSACETGTDALVPGEGISGLVRAFLHAGAPRVIASLWQVPDAPTRALMERFYALLGDPALSVAEALRRAQEHVRTAGDGRWAGPENWAAWTLWGVP